MPDARDIDADIFGADNSGTAAASHRDNGTAIYRAAIDATTAVLAARARSYRTLILVVAVGIGGACLWALFAKSFAPLGMLMLVCVIVGTFFWLDARRLSRWRAELLRPWQRRELDFAALSAAVRAIPGLPVESVDAMLTSLPQARDLEQEREWGVKLRSGMATALSARDRKDAARLLLKTLLLLMAGFAVGIMLLLRTP